MKKRMLPLLLCLAVLFSACGADTDSEKVSTEAPNAASQIEESVDSALSEESEPSLLEEEDSGMFSKRDFRTTYDEDESVQITLSGDTATCTGDGVTVSGSTVTIEQEGTYVLSGSLKDGMVIVDTDKETKVQLVLCGVDIHSESSAAIYVRKADKVFITLPEGTENTLSSGETYVDIDDNSIDAALFSKDDLTLNGSGSLTIEAPGGHGVVVKDSLTVTGGSYTVTAASHALSGKKDISIADGSFTLNSGKDGLHAANKKDETEGFVYIEGGDFHITSQGDGISGEVYVEISGGSFDILSGGGYENAEPHSDSGFPGFPGMETTTEEDDSVSTKGIKAEGDLTISGGTFKIDAADDTIHSNSSIYITGGTFDLASGDDGIHADRDLDISDGVIGIATSYEGLEALNVRISGGKINLVATDDGINGAGDAVEEETETTGEESEGSVSSLAFSGEQLLLLSDGNDGFPGMPEGMDGENMPTPPGDMNGDMENMPTPPDGASGDTEGFPEMPGGFPGDFGGDEKNQRGGGPGGGGPGGFGGFGGFPGMENSNATIVISGGEIYINASGDHIDANGTIEITGGTVVTCGPVWGDTAVLDYDKTASISGSGLFIGTGSTMMAQDFTEAEHGQLFVRTGNQTAGTTLTVLDSDGNTIYELTPELDYALLVFSGPDLVKGETYTICVGETSMEAEAY